MASSIKTSFSFKGTVESVDHFQGGRLVFNLVSEDGHKLSLTQQIAVGEAKVVGTEIDRAGEDLPVEAIPVQVGDSASISVSITASGAPSE